MLIGANAWGLHFYGTAPHAACRGSILPLAAETISFIAWMDPEIHLSQTSRARDSEVAKILTLSK